LRPISISLWDLIRRTCSEVMFRVLLDRHYGHLWSQNWRSLPGAFVGAVCLPAGGMLSGCSAPSATTSADGAEKKPRAVAGSEEAIQEQISHCWKVPADRNYSDLSVEIAVVMNENATVKSTLVVDQARLQADERFRTLAETAVRALRDPACQPFKMPMDKFPVWQRLVFVFNPKDMF
jgi:hypothetical protein